MKAVSSPAKKPTATAGRTPRRCPICFCHAASQSNVWNAVQLAVRSKSAPLRFHRGQLAENMGGEVRHDAVPRFAAARLELFLIANRTSPPGASLKRSNSLPSRIRDRIDKLCTCDTPTSEGAEIRSKSLTRSLLIRAPSGCRQNVAASTTEKKRNWWLDFTSVGLAN
jgi:hypothetical protein